MQRWKNLGEVTSMCSQVQLRFKSITGVWVINASVLNLGRVFASLTRNILFWYKIKLSGSHSDGKKEVTSTVISPYVCTSSFWVRHSTQFQEGLARTFRLSAYVAFDSRFICWLCSFVFIMKREKKLSSFFTPKKMAVEPEKQIRLGWKTMTAKREESVRWCQLFKISIS